MNNGTPEIFPSFFDVEAPEFVPTEYNAWKAACAECERLAALLETLPEGETGELERQYDAKCREASRLQDIAFDAYDVYVRQHYKRHG